MPNWWGCRLPSNRSAGISSLTYPFASQYCIVPPMSDPKPQDNLFQAIILAFLTAFFLAAMNLFGKMLGSHLSPLEITFVRNTTSLALLVAGFLVMGNFSQFKTKRPFAQATRALVGTIGIFLGFWAVTIMPLATATVLIFTQPLWVVLLSYPLLGEKVGLYRVLGTLAGFAGVYIVVGPNSDLGLFEITIGLGAGLFSGLVALCLRWLGHSENASTTVFYFLLIGALATGSFLPFTETHITDLTMLTSIIGLIFGLGFFGIAQQITKTYSYRLGDASVITPISYTMIVWAGLFDYLIWGNLPSKELLMGSSLIIASNMFILWREQQSQKSQNKDQNSYEQK